ncbi:MAG: hypothetical protein FWE11_02360 [Defluviitaleaceae bacterium]|nr:hypothetical protein [Defluviitaleaceae bacterium]
MKRRLTAAVITLILVLSTIVPVYAGPASGDHPPPLGPPQGRSIAIALSVCVDYCDCDVCEEPQ